MTPWAVVRPGSAEEVQRIVAWANETATPLVPVSSGGPHFHGDTVPSVPGAVMLDLRRMDRVLRVDRRNRMAVIEPGVTYPQLQAALAEQGMRVTPPLYPRANKSVVASLLERQPTLIPRYNFQLPEPLRSCGVVWGNGDVMFTGEAGSGPLSLEAQWDAGLVQADPKGPGQTDFFRLLTGAQGTFGVVTWAAVRCEIVPAAHEYVFAAAAELDELVDFIYRLDRIRLGDEVLIVNDAYLARLLKSADATVDPDALPAWTLVLGLGGREHYAAERVAVQKKDAEALAGEFGLTLQASVPGTAAGDIAAVLAGCCADAVEARRGGRLRRRALRHHARGGARLHRDRPHRRRRSRLRRGGRRRLHPAAAPGRDASRRVQPAVRRPRIAATAEDMKDLATTSPPISWPPAPTSAGPYGSWAQPVYNRDAAARDALRKVKAIFDPAGVLNPGKLCFGAPRPRPALVAKEA